MIDMNEMFELFDEIQAFDDLELLTVNEKIWLDEFDLR